MRGDRGGVAAGLAATVAAALLITGVVVGGWRLGWWMQAKATSYQAHITEHSYGAQSGAVTAVEQAIRAVADANVQLADPKTPASEKPALRAQIQAVVDQACTVEATIDSPPTDVAAWAAANCS